MNRAIRENTTAIILAGGVASRMGGEKALRLLRGRTLLSHALELAAGAASRVVVAAGPREYELPAGVIRVADADEFSGAGPLAGILAGLESARGSFALLLACDLPNLPAALLNRLMESLTEDLDVVHCGYAGRVEPLVAALRVATTAAAVRRALESGDRRVEPVWQSLARRVLREAELAEFAPLDRTFANLNTLDNLSEEEGREI